MKKHLTSKYFSFKTKIILFVCIFNLLVVNLISILNYKWHTQQITQQSISQTQQIIEQLSVNIDDYVDELFRLTLSPYYSNDVMNALENDELINSEVDKLNNSRIIENYLASTMTLPRNEVLRVYILTANNIYSYTRTPYDMADYNSYKSSIWFNEALSTTHPILIPVHSEKAYGNSETQILSVARQIRSFYSNNHSLGVVKVDANYSGIQNICNKVLLGNNAALFILDSDNETIYSNYNNVDNHSLISQLPLSDNNSSFTYSIDGDKYIVNLKTSENTGLKTIAINSYSSITNNARSDLAKTIVLTLLSIVISTTILIIIIEKSFNPLSSMINSMKSIDNGIPSTLIQVNRNDEIGYLAKTYNQMITNLKISIDENTELIEQMYKLQYLQKETQYNALCNQIKPHFLYNTLNTVSLLIKCNENDKAVKSIEDLSLFLRGVMHSDRDITMKQEIDIVIAYCSLINIRYGNKIEFDISIEKSLYDLTIPALIIQPIVENSVKHGCECKRGNSKIEIISSINNEQLILSITDNGVGMDNAKLEALKSSFYNQTESSNSNIMSEHIGLINVYNRLKLKFGNSVEFTINSEVDVGTKVEIIIPLDCISNNKGECADNV